MPQTSPKQNNFAIGTASIAEMEEMARMAAREGWNPGLTDMQAFMTLDPCGFLVGRIDGVARSFISAVRYHNLFAFMGFYIVHPDQRGQGYGLPMWHAALARLDGYRIGLDGVPLQQKNYEKSGFQLAWNNVRYIGAVPVVDRAKNIQIISASEIPFDKLVAYDRRFFPAPRDAFLSPWVFLPERVARVAMMDGEIVGFGVMRRCQEPLAKVGPLYAANADIAIQLLGEMGRDLGATQMALDVPSFHKGANDIVRDLYMTPAFETGRMYRGEIPDFDRAGLYGITSFELG